MPDFRYEMLHIDKLHPDTENFRFDPMADESKAISTMLNQMPTKIYNLIHSIVENNGIDPSILPNVVPYSHGSDDYVVMEGNRRITSLKIIKNIELIKNTSHYEKIKRLLDKYDLTKIPNTYFCTIYESKDDTYYWTYLRHAGELGGEGLVSWNSLSIDRFRIATKQAEPNISYYIINYLRLNSDYKVTHKRISSTLKRVVESSAGKTYYGVSIFDKQLQFEKDKNETVEKLKLLVGRMESKNITSRNTNTLAQIESWIIRLDNEYLSLHPATDVLEDKAGGASQSDVSHFHSEFGGMNTSSNKKGSQSSNDYVDAATQMDNGGESSDGTTHLTQKPTARVKTKKFVEDLSYSHLDAQKYNGMIKLCNELVRLSKASSGSYTAYPIASAMLLRSLIEQAFKYYLTKSGCWDNFYTKHKEKNSKAEDPALGAILIYCRNQKEVIFTDKTFLRLFNILFKDDASLKDYLDLNIHHPNIVTITSVELDIFSNKGIASFINYLMQ